MKYNDPIRDSIFSTEWFNWPISAEIKYDRMMLFAQPGYCDLVIDSSVVYDTLGDSSFVYDSLPGTFHLDSTYRTDSGFIAPGVEMTYIVQLVHQSGHIDTVESVLYNPFANQLIKPTTIHIANAGTAADTVMLRVLGNFSGIPDADTDAEFDRETMLDVYPTYSDTTIAIGTGGGIVPPPDTCFYAMGPYENPSEPLENDVSVLVHYCGLSSTITAQVYTSLGTPVGTPTTYTSDGQVWDRLPITSPPVSGSYYITVTVGAYSNTLGYTVY